MVEAATTTTTERVRDAVAAVPDPELPPVTVGMLGMIHDITVEDGHASIEMLPTFSGCPATEMMGRDIEEAVTALEDVDEATVRWRFSPRWTSEMITEEGHEQLREFGIAPPAGEADPDGTLEADGRRSLPVIGTAVAGTGPGGDARPCPYCGSEDTVRDSPFGPTPCRDMRFCDSCNQPFEAFKSL